jgi:predicted dehydrogenase
LFTKTGAAATAFTIVKPHLVRGQGKALLKAGLVGCGGRGTAAIMDMMNGSENTEVVAMGDLFEDRLEGSLASLRKHRDFPKFESRIKVAPDKRFTGFDAFKKVINSDIDIVMLCTPPGWRPIHFEAAIAAKKHVFCEKPFGTDPVGVRRFMAAAKKSEELKLTVMSGAQRRFDPAYMENVKKIQDGSIGDITAAYAYWIGTPVIQQKARDAKWGDMTWQHRNWYSFVWICGDQIVEQHLHNIDVVNWIMGTHPVKVVATGGAVWRPREELYGNIYDHVSADFVYANGVRMSSYCRQFPRQGRDSKIYGNVSEEIAGSKGRMKLQQVGGPGYRFEHTAMINSIRGDGPYINHGMAVAESTMTCIMGRESAYSGEEITWDQMMNSQLDLMPKENSWNYDGKVEVPPLPIPGEYKFR